MIEVWILVGLGLIWLVFATVSDLKKSEIPNWLNFSLIVFALGVRFFYSLFSNYSDFSFFYQGVLGVLFFVILGEVFYYSKMFAGGDEKLMWSLGAILPIFPNFYQNLEVFLAFILLYLFVGAFYGIVLSVAIGLINFKKMKKGFVKLFEEKRRWILIYTLFSIVFLVLSFYIENFIYFAIFIFVFPYFYLFLKAVDDFCMVRKISSKKLTPGDWLYEDVKVKGKTIRATWSGLSSEEIKLLKNKKEVLVRYGLQFSPVFLVSFILLFIFLEAGILNSFFSLFGL